jgi:beta-aspartyl-peptidase (threonine type)
MSDSTSPSVRLTWGVVGLFLAGELACALLIVAGVAVLLGGWNILSAAPPAAADQAIRQVLTDQAAAWNRGDLDGFMAGYWRDPNLTFFSEGTVTRGWDATIERYRKRYKSEGKEMGKLTFSELDVQVLGDDAAVVRGRWGLELSSSKPGGLFTLLFRKKAEGWRIVHDHTSAAPEK